MVEQADLLKHVGAIRELHRIANKRAVGNAFMNEVCNCKHAEAMQELMIAKLEALVRHHNRQIEDCQVLLKSLRGGA